MVWCQLSAVLRALLGLSVLCFKEGQAERGKTVPIRCRGMCELSPIRSSSCVSIQTFAIFLLHFAKSCGVFYKGCVLKEGCATQTRAALLP